MLKLKIVVLDGYTVDKGDICWDKFKEIGEISIYNWTESEKIEILMRDAEIILTNKVPITAEIIEKIPWVKYIGVLATGFDLIDLEAARRQCITVTNVTSYATNSVSQLTFALILELCHNVKYHSDTVKLDKKWSKSKYNSYWDYPIIELANKTLGIIGMGMIGKNVARLGACFGMNVIGHDTNRHVVTELNGFRWVAFDELLEVADIISIHCPLLPQTKGIINKEALIKMKNSAWLINTSRGGLIMESDLYWALKEGEIAAAALDVLEKEPPLEDNPLFNIDNCILTPHIGWASVEARMKLVDIAFENIKSFLNGNPVNVVSI